LIGRAETIRRPTIALTITWRASTAECYFELVAATNPNTPAQLATASFFCPGIDGWKYARVEMSLAVSCGVAPPRDGE
jgi:hypothetical protein